MKVLVTGADGFIGTNLRVSLGEHADMEALPVTRSTSDGEFMALAARADAAVHLAGINRPDNPAEFDGNVVLAERLCQVLRGTRRAIPVAYSSSAQAGLAGPYADSKRAAERCLLAYASETASPLAIYRLPNVFGKWGRPNYNSVVSTFCYNIARGLPIRVNDDAAPLSLVYIDDVVADLLRFLAAPAPVAQYVDVQPVYTTTVGALARQLYAFGDVRSSLVSERVGSGLVRALYATFVSYLPTEKFAYALPKYEDARGMFVEMLKTQDSGQFSAFTAHPGITRGGHYHHSKTEKFLVVRGDARFRFRHLATGALYQLDTSGANPTVVETIPGWVHDITNVGTDEMVVLLWANEIFDREHPDTIAQAVAP